MLLFVAVFKPETAGAKHIRFSPINPNVKEGALISFLPPNQSPFTPGNYIRGTAEVQGLVPQKGKVNPPLATGQPAIFVN
jgi:hypothetical protein